MPALGFRGRFAFVLAITVVLDGTLAPDSHAQSPGWNAAASMTVARSGHIAIRLGDGRVLVAGGLNGSLTLSSAEVFDPQTNAWTAVASMSVPRYFATATLLPDGRVMVAGGYNGGATGSNVNASTELFDPFTGLWSAGPSMKVARHSHTATTLDDGRILVTGGYTNGTEFAQ